MAAASDMDLVREYASRNSEPAFAELVRRHINLVYSVALRFTGNNGDAQDVTQAVFIILARKAGSLAARTVLTGWLYETTRFTALQSLRSRARRHAHEQEASMQSILDQPDPDTVWRQLAPHLEAAMSRLTERDRTLLALRYFENKTGGEAAALLGIREESARKQTNRALEKLRKFFSRRGVNSTAESIAGAISANSIHSAPIALAKTVTAVSIAKGAAASTSTLTLIKGALKIMTWTKAKTALVATVAVLLTAGTTTIVIKATHAPRVAYTDQEVGALVEKLKLEDLRAEDCTPEFWQQLQQRRQAENPDFVKALPAAMGPLRTVTMILRKEDHGRPSYLFRMEYENMTVIFKIIFDGKKIAFAEGSPASK